MRAVVAWLGLISILPLVGLVVLVTVAIHAARKRYVSAPMLSAALVGVAAMVPGAWSFGALTMTFPYDRDEMTPSATGRLPLDGPVRVAWGGDDVAHNQHAMTPDQRWAYDLVVEPAANESTRLEDYGCWGKPVRAPLDATVHHVIDGQPDATPGALSPNAEHPLGNAVILRTTEGTFLVLAHLQKGSVAVAADAPVREGDLLGRCGNSGNTSEPHVHIHHQRQDPTQYPVNFAEGLPLYFRDHGGAPMPRGGFEKNGDAVKLTGDVVEHRGASATSRATD
jgi:hypothetical protein